MFPELEACDGARLTRRDINLPRGSQASWQKIGKGRMYLFPSPGRPPILDMSGFGLTMGINAHVISELDPGAIPGGSTITSQA